MASLTVAQQDISDASTASTTLEYVSHHWNQLAAKVGMTEPDSYRIWSEVIRKNYTEIGRYYHTLDHIRDMLLWRTRLEDQFIDIVSVDMAIFFHDIIYDPTSKTNEEDSSLLFEQLLGSLRISSIDIVKVCHYINQTKKHEVGDSEDNDLKLFIDIDMSIIGREADVYKDYAMKIRKEYCHYNDGAYCSGRASFLKSVLASGKPTFVSAYFHGLLEEQARRNIAWECELLDSGCLVE
jgi:predicted metal-dependent HD superfamily phosphohydrolase